MGNLEFGAAFSRVFALYGKHFVPLLIWSAIFQGAMAVVIAILFVSFLSGGAVVGLIGAPLTIILVMIAGAAMTGAYVVGLDEADRSGSFPGFGEVWPKLSPKLGSLIVTSLLAGLGMLLGFLALIVPFFILLTWWAVISPVVMLENRSGTDALGRSRELVRGNGWTVFGLIIVTAILTGIANWIIGGIVGGILGGSDTLLGTFGAQLVGGSLTAPVGALLAIVMYQALVGADGSGGDTNQSQAPYAPPATPDTPPGMPPTNPGQQGPFV